MPLSIQDLKLLSATQNDEPVTNLQQPATQQASPLNQIDTSKYKVDTNKLGTDIFDYTASLFKDYNVTSSLANYANTQEGGFTGMPYLVAAKDNPELIGMNKDEVEKNPVKAISNVMGRNISEVAYTKFLEEYKATGDISKADAKARDFINTSVQGLASFKPGKERSESDTARFNDVFNRFASEDMSKGIVGYSDPDAIGKIYQTTMSKSMDTTFKEGNDWGNFFTSFISSASSTEGFIESAVGIFSDSYADYMKTVRDQQKNVFVQQELSDIGSKAVTTGEILGTVAGIGAVIAEAVPMATLTPATGGTSAAVAGTRLAMAGRTALRLGGYFLQRTARGAVQDTLDNDALAKKYIISNQYQDADYRAMAASRMFDIATGIVGDVAGAYAKGLIAQRSLVGGMFKSSIAEKMAKDTSVSGARLIANASVMNGFKEAATEVGLESFIDISTHNALASMLNDGENKFFTEGQNVSLDLGTLIDNPDMAVRYLATRAFGRLAGSIPRIKELSAQNEAKFKDSDWAISDLNKDDALQGWQKTVKRISNIFSDNVMSSIDANMRNATAREGGPGVGLREIYTDTTVDESGLTKAQKFEKAFGSRAIMHAYANTALSNNVMVGYLLNKTTGFSQDFATLVNGDESNHEVLSDFIGRINANRYIDLSKTTSSGTTLDNMQKYNAINTVVDHFIPDNIDVKDLDKAIDYSGSFILRDNMIDSKSTNKDGSISVFDMFQTGVINKLKQIASNADKDTTLTPEEKSNIIQLAANANKKFNAMFSSKGDMAAQVLNERRNNIDDVYLKLEQDARYKVANMTKLDNPTDEYLDKIYGNKDQMLEKLKSLSKDNLQARSKDGDVFNFYKRFANDFIGVQEGVTKVHQINDELAKELQSLSPNVINSIDDKGNALIKLDKLALKAGESLINKEIDKINALAESAISLKDKQKGYTISMERIKILSSQFSYKIQPHINKSFRGLAKTVISDINRAFSTVTWIDDNRIRTLLSNEFVKDKQSDDDLRKDAFATLYASMLKRSSNVFFNEKVIADAFKSDNVSKALHYAMFDRYIGGISGRVGSAVKNPELTAELSNFILNANVPQFHMLYDGDKITVTANGYMQNAMNPKDVKFEPTDDDKSALTKAIVSKVLGRFIVSKIGTINIGMDTNLINNIVEASIKYIKSETGIQPNESAVKAIVETFINKRSDTMSIKGYLNDIVEEGSVVKDDTKLSILMSKILASSNQRVNMPFWGNLDSTKHIDFNATFNIRVNGEEDYLDHKQLLKTLDLADYSNTPHGKVVASIISMSINEQDAIANVRKYIDEELKINGIELVGHMDSRLRPDGSEVATNDDALTRLSYNLVHDNLANSSVALSLNLSANELDSKFVFALNNIAVKHNLFDGAWLVDMNTDDFNKLSDKDQAQLNRIGLLRIGQSGTAASPVYLYIPMFDFSQKNSLSRFIVDYNVANKLEASFSEYDTSSFKELYNVSLKTSTDEVIKIFDKIKDDIADQLETKTQAVRDRYSEFKDVKIQSLKKKFDYDYSLAVSDLQKGLISLDSKINELTGTGIFQSRKPDDPLSADESSVFKSSLEEFVGMSAPIYNQIGDTVVTDMTNKFSDITNKEFTTINDVLVAKNQIANLYNEVNARMQISQELAIKDAMVEMPAERIGRERDDANLVAESWLTGEDPNLLGKELYDKFDKQLKNIDELKEAKVNRATTNTDIMAQVAQMVLLKDMFFNATDLQKRMATALTTSGPKSARLEAMVDKAIADTNARAKRDPKVWVVYGDYYQTAGVVFRPSWEKEYWETVSSYSDGNKMATTDQGDLMKLMFETTESFIHILGDREILTADGTRITKDDIDINDKIFTVETYKAIGSGMMDAFPSITKVDKDQLVKQAMTLSGQEGAQRIQDSGGRIIPLKQNYIDIHGNIVNLYKDMALNRTNPHSNIKNVANETNVSVQVSVSDPSMKLVVNKMLSKQTGKALDKVSKIIDSNDSVLDTNKAMQGVITSIQNGMKVQGGNTSIGIQIGKINRDIGCVLIEDDAKVSHKFTERTDVELNSVGVGIKDVLMHLRKHKTYIKGDDQSVRDLHKRLVQNQNNLDVAKDDIIKAMDILCTGDEPIFAKLEGRYFCLAVRYPADTMGSLSLHSIRYIQNSKLGDGLRMDPYYAPRVNSADADGDKAALYPVDIETYFNSVSKTYGVTSSKWSDIKSNAERYNLLTKGMALHLINSVEMSRRKSLTISSDEPLSFAESKDIGMELGGLVSTYSKLKVWSDSQHSLKGHALKSVGLKIDEDAKDIIKRHNSVFDVVLDKPLEVSLTNVDAIHNVQQQNSFRLMSKTSGTYGAMQCMGTVVGDISLEKEFVFGGKSYKLMATVQGDANHSAKYVYILETDGDGTKFIQKDFGLKTAGVFQIRGSYDDRDSVFNSIKNVQSNILLDNINSIYNEITSMIKSNNKIVGLENLVKSIAHGGDFTKLSDGKNEVRVTSTNMMFPEANNTGVNNSKTKGLASIVRSYSGNLLKSYEETVSNMLNGEAVLISNFTPSGKAMIGNATGNVPQDVMSQIDTRSLVEIYGNNLNQQATVGYKDFEAIYKLTMANKLNTHEQLNDAIQAYFNTRLKGLTDDGLGDMFDANFITAYRSIEMFARKSLGLDVANGTPSECIKFHPSSEQWNKDQYSYIGKNGLPVYDTYKKKGWKIGDEETKIYTLATKVKLNTAGQVLAKINGANSTNAAQTVVMALKSVELPATVKINPNQDPNTMFKSLVDEVYTSIKANGNSATVTRQQVDAVLKDLLSSNDIRLSTAETSGQEMVTNILSQIPQGYDQEKYLANNKRLTKLLRDSYQDNKVKSVRLTGKGGKPMTSGAFVDMVNGLISGYKSGKLQNLNTFASTNETLQALVGIMGNEVHNAAFIRKLGFNNDVANKYSKHLLENMKDGDGSLYTTLEFDKSIALDFKTSSFTDFHISMDYTPANVSKVYRTNVDLCGM